jgi:hypothetical protein
METSNNMMLHTQTDEQDEPLKASAASQIDCGKDPIAALKQMFVDMIMNGRIAAGQNPAQRPVFLKPHGVARGTFTVRPDLPEELRTGVFRYESFPVWIRFSSDTIPSSPDFKTTIGIGLKLFGVPGKKVLEPETDAETHDFLLQNHDVFFVDAAKDMCEFTYAGVVQHDYASYLKLHPKTDQILSDMEKEVASVLDTSYWSVLPYRFGENRYAKYKLIPCLIPKDGTKQESLSDHPTYLHEDLKKRLGEADACFNFYVQLQTDPEKMPLDQATVRWDEKISEPVHVATITIPRQQIDARGQSQYGENLAYNPWHALPEHAPVGSISEARRVAYEAAAELRRNVNGVPVVEPQEPRPVETVQASPRDINIVRAAIHPAIGIARVGNSENEFFIGPEVTEPKIEPEGFYKDAKGALKRQAARFRVYGYNGAGEVVAELTADNSDIKWTVHVANKKAAWYQFQLAMDIPEASLPSLEPTRLRNRDVQGADRRKLVIDPGPRTIAGRGKSGNAYKFDSGKFFDKPVYLGELQTDDDGRLIFLGGRGVSESNKGPDTKPTTFANNDGWHDDVSDGPVTAEVSIRGQVLPVDPSWVVVAPPNYAPDVIGVRTMYDLMFDTFVQEGRLPFPKKISFTRDIYPILRRLSNLQWVNHGFSVQYGTRGSYNFMEPAYIARLADASNENKELRRQICNTFRDFQRDGLSPVPWPWLYGDAMSIPPVNTPRQHVAISSTQYLMLQLWAEGKFESDWKAGDTPAPDQLGKVKLPEQPAMLDRAALHFCLADAFHPGCEMTWPMRHASLYMAPFRIRHRKPEDGLEQVNGSILTPETVMLPNGVLYGQRPGTLSRWMAVPWQTDTASCLSGYEFEEGLGPRYDPFLPTFWPARVPNHVLTEANYKIVVDETKPHEERVKAFNERAVWLRVLSQDYLEAIAQMIHDFGKLGVVETRPGVKGDPDLPEAVLVESRPEFLNVEAIPPHRNLVALHVTDVDVNDTQALADAVSAATKSSGRSEEQFMSGVIDKVRRFRNTYER